MKITKLVLSEQERMEDFIFLLSVILKRCKISDCPDISVLLLQKNNENENMEKFTKKLKDGIIEIKNIKSAKDVSELKQSDFMNDYLFIYFSDDYEFPVKFSDKLEAKSGTADILNDCNIVLVCENSQKSNLEKYDFFHLNL